MVRVSGRGTVSYSLSYGGIQWFQSDYHVAVRSRMPILARRKPGERRQWPKVGWWRKNRECSPIGTGRTGELSARSWTIRAVVSMSSGVSRLRLGLLRLLGFRFGLEEVGSSLVSRSSGELPNPFLLFLRDPGWHEFSYP